jgi:hypothetical protein
MQLFLLKILIILSLFFPISVKSQILITGKIINRSTKEIIPFATIGLLKENIGTSADDNGIFNIKSRIYPEDTLIVSSVGYVNKILPLSQLPINSTIELDVKQKTLSEVFISNKQIKPEILNDFSSCSLNWFNVGQNSIVQVAQYFHAPSPNMYLSKINICKMGTNCLFRIRIYDVDSVFGNPSVELTDSVIEVQSSKKYIQIDLEKYKIRIPDKDFFVALEWIYIPINSYTEKTKINGRKSLVTFYHPSICFRRHSNEDMTNINSKIFGL